MLNTYKNIYFFSYAAETICCTVMQYFPPLTLYLRPENIKWFIEVVWFGSAPCPFSPSPHSPVSKLSLLRSLPVCRQLSLLTGGGRGWGRSQIIWPQESLALYKSFNTLCLRPCSILPLRKLFLCIVFPLVFFLKLALSYLWCFKVFSKRVFRIPPLIGPDPDPCIQTTCSVPIGLIFYRERAS